MDWQTLALKDEPRVWSDHDYRVTLITDARLAVRMGNRAPVAHGRLLHASRNRC